LNQAATANRNNRTARFFYAVCLEQSKLDTEALNEFDTLAREGGEWDADASLRAAELFLKQGDLDKARESVERAETAGASGPAFFTTRGRVLMRAGEDGAARDALQRAIAADSGYAPAHLEMGLVHIKGQQFDEALAELSRFMELLGPASEEPQYDEIRSLVTQIQQTTDNQGAAPAGSSSGREES
jgi:tetratricopeptide (TPR) repeat protein